MRACALNLSFVQPRLVSAEFVEVEGVTSFLSVSILAELFCQCPESKPKTSVAIICCC